MMKKLVLILFVLASVAASGQIKKNGGDTTRIVMYCGNRYSAIKPLIVVNGKIYKDSLATINVNNISSITVLKDGISTALYGEEGKNGVILITTKHKKKKNN